MKGGSSGAPPRSALASPSPVDWLDAVEEPVTSSDCCHDAAARATSAACEGAVSFECLLLDGDTGSWMFSCTSGSDVLLERDLE